MTSGPEWYEYALAPSAALLAAGIAVIGNDLATRRREARRLRAQAQTAARLLFDQMSIWLNLLYGAYLQGFYVPAAMPGLDAWNQHALLVLEHLEHDDAETVSAAASRIASMGQSARSASLTQQFELDDEMRAVFRADRDRVLAALDVLADFSGVAPPHRESLE